MRGFLARLLMIPLLVLASCATNELESEGPAAKAADGLWLYTGLTTSGGQSMPLSGIFLFKDGEFLQQAIFDGSPFNEQGAMAHAGTYSVTPVGVNLIAEQTISIAPAKSPSLSFRPNTRHELTVDRTATSLKLVFGSGTIQTFQHAGAGRGQVFKLENGRFALSDGYFILVAGDANGAVTGYGRYDNAGDRYSLKVMRWSESANGTSSNQKDVTIDARFDGKALVLPDGRRFAVVS